MKKVFSGKGKIFSASSPGRLDVMGGVADYSGSLLLQMPIREKVAIQLQKREDGWFHLTTWMDGHRKTFRTSIRELEGKSYPETGNMLRGLPEGYWASYIIGCFVVLQKEKNLRAYGATLVIHSTIPPGKGVSSSAALEVAVMKVISKAYALKLGKTELPVLCQRVENEIAGAACGLMDQLSVYLGQKKKLLPLICQPHKVFPAVKIPPGVQFIGIDSGIRHAVSGSSYADVRTAAFMGYTIIALQEGVSINALKNARSHHQWNHLPYNGYLANISLSVFNNEYEHLLPETISGTNFLAQYADTIDGVTEVNPYKEYRIRVCAAHPVYENHRIHIFRQLLSINRKSNLSDTLVLMGELMFQSHAGYSMIGLGNPVTDEIVNLIKEAGPASGVFGARITGGGSGGTVCVLANKKKGKRTVEDIHARFKTQSKKELYLFS